MVSTTSSPSSLNGSRRLSQEAQGGWGPSPNAAPGGGAWRLNEFNWRLKWVALT
jgi:hypothetical protein